MASNDYGLGHTLPVSDEFRQDRLMEATRRFTQQLPTTRQQPTDEYIFPGTDGNMPRTQETRTRQDYVRRPPSTSTSSTSGSIFDNEDEDPNYVPDGVAPLGGNRHSAPRNNTRRQQHNRDRMQSQWGAGRGNDDGDVSSDPEERLRRLAGNLRNRDKDRARTKKGKR
jgi:hypothetical protein